MNHVLAESSRKTSHLNHFVCPICHKPIVDADGMIARQCCGRAIDHDGTTVNFLGDRAHIFGEKRDSQIAKSLVSYRNG